MLNVRQRVGAMDQVQYFSTADQSVSLIEGQYQSFEFKRHYHLDYHIGLILGGQQSFTYQGERYQVGHGDLVIMPPDELHDGCSANDLGYKAQVFAIEPYWFERYVQTSQTPSYLSFKQPVIRDAQVFQFLDNAHHLLRQSSLSQLAQDCLPYDSFEPLIQRYSVLKPLSPYRLGRSTLQTLKAFLLAHLSEPIHLVELATLCDLSPTQFQRHFKATTGITPYAWLTRLRLEQAMKLLKANVSGTEVAQQVGFYDQAHFSKSFKQAFGVSPSEVR